MAPHSHNKILSCHFTFVIQFSIRTFYLCLECVCVFVWIFCVYLFSSCWSVGFLRCVYVNIQRFSPLTPSKYIKQRTKKVRLFELNLFVVVCGAFVYVCPISCLFIRLFVYFFVPLPMCWLSMEICVDFHFLPWIVYAYTNWKKILTNSVYSVVVYTTPWVMDTTILNVYCKLPITFRMLSSWATKIHTYCIFCRGIVSDYLYVCTTRCARGCFGMRFAVCYLLVSMILLYSENTRLYISLGP